MSKKKPQRSGRAPRKRYANAGALVRCQRALKKRLSIELKREATDLFMRGPADLDATLKRYHRMEVSARPKRIVAHLSNDDLRQCFRSARLGLQTGIYFALDLALEAERK
jgi:hypothetical protein